jgi:hypothetical protein
VLTDSVTLPARAAAGRRDCVGAWVPQGDCPEIPPPDRRRLLSVDATGPNGASRFAPSWTPPPCGPNTTTGERNEVFTITTAARGGGAECEHAGGDVRVASCEAPCPPGTCMQSPVQAGLVNITGVCHWSNASTCTAPCDGGMTTQDVEYINGAWAFKTPCPP